MEEKLSSPWATFSYKIFFPITWIGGFGFGTLAVWIGNSEDPVTKIFFLGGLIIGSVFLLRDVFRLKTISICENDLIIKNFTLVVRVPLSHLYDVTESKFMCPNTISILIDPPCEFGKKVTFIPKSRSEIFFNPFSAHPIAKRLRELTGSRT